MPCHAMDQRRMVAVSVTQMWLSQQQIIQVPDSRVYTKVPQYHHGGILGA